MRLPDRSISPCHAPSIRSPAGRAVLGAACPSDADRCLQSDLMTDSRRQGLRDHRHAGARFERRDPVCRRRQGINPVRRGRRERHGAPQGIRRRLPEGRRGVLRPEKGGRATGTTLLVRKVPRVMVYPRHKGVRFVRGHNQAVENRPTLDLHVYDGAPPPGSEFTPHYFRHLGVEQLIPSRCFPPRLHAAPCRVLRRSSWLTRPVVIVC